jgi:hypothetical protein
VLKYAALEMLDAWRQPAAGGISRVAHRVAFHYDPRPGYLYVRSRMISSRTNDNHDTFPAGEIEKGYRTFLGKPVFVNHNNANHRRARGVIVAVALHRDQTRDGKADTWVEGLMEVDAVKFPKLAKAILEGKVNRTSMGVDVDWSTCSACGNKATSPAEYCKHLPAMKGRKIRQRNKKTGKVEERLIHEICAGLSFFENSLLVEDPADPTAYLIGKPDTRGMEKAAALRRAQARRPFGELAPHEQQAVGLYHRQMLEEGNAPQGSTTGDYLYEPRQEPRGEFIDRYMDADDEFKREYGRGAPDWEAHHQDTVARHPIPYYPAEGRWPLIVSDANPNYIDDGYHRMHSYMRDDATEIPTIRMHPRPASKTAAAGDPDFRDHFGNTCYMCGEPVAYLKGARGRPGRFAHDSAPGSRDYDHEADPVNPDDTSGRMSPSTFGGTRCAVCGEDVKINLRALGTASGGWHHHDGMKRDHPAIPLDPQAVYDSVPGARAVMDQARQQVRERLHSQFEQLEGRPLPRSPRGDEDQMPPDPFTARRKRPRRQAAGRFRDEFTHCSNCGVPLLNADDISAANSPGDWSHHGYPHLCMNCAIGPISDEGTIPGTPGKPHPIFPGDKGGYHLRPGLAGDPMFTDRLPESYRNWEPGDAIRQSTSSRSWPESSDRCAGCGAELGGEDSPMSARSPVVPSLCTWCGSRSAGYPDHVPNPDLMGEGQREFTARDYLPPSFSSRRVAYGETRVPPQVDTLRMDECPVCGEHNVWSGSRCPVCGFVVPPSVFRDPDTDKARQVRDQLDSSGEVTDDQMGPQDPGMGEEPVGSGDDADDQLTHPDQIAPDGVPVVQGEGGPVPGEDDDGQEGAPPEEEDEEQGEPGEIPDDAGEEDEFPEDDGEEPGDELECPACGTTFETDAYAQPGMPCPACGMANLHPIDENDDGGEFPPDDEDPDGEEEGDGPQKDQEDDPSAPGDEKEEDEDMPASKTGAALAQAQARRIAELSAQNEALSAQLRFLASAAGVERELAEVGRRVMRRHADIMNPASPVPDPPEGPPSETTEQALMPEAMDDPSRPGATPGANSRVPAAQTTTAITPGVEMQTPPATNLVDVTAPIQGTNPSQDGGVPIEQRRIETDVRVDPDPLKAHGPGIGGQGDNGSAFPWVLDARMPDQGGQPGQGQRAASLRPQQGEAESSRRTFGAIRLAKLRVQAGLAQGDELTVAERIERDASLSTAMIEHDISTLEQVGAMARPQAPIQRQAARSAPSLASVGAASQYAPAVALDDDGSDIFL